MEKYYIRELDAPSVHGPLSLRNLIDIRNTLHDVTWLDMGDEGYLYTLIDYVLDAYHRVDDLDVLICFSQSGVYGCELRMTQSRRKPSITNACRASAGASRCTVMSAP